MPNRSSRVGKDLWREVPKREHRAWAEGDFGFRIAKLGTRPKGGSPKDNLEIKEPESRIQNIEIKIEFLFSHDYFIPTLCAMRLALCFFYT